MNRTLKTFVGTVVLVTGLAAVPAMAQTEGQAQPPATSIQPTDAQLQKFVEASEKVSVVAEEYRPKVNSAADDGSRQQIIQEAEEKMARLVTEDGLTVDQFIAINQAVEQDPQLRQRVVDIANRTGG